jgi:hypothetical protein
MGGQRIQESWPNSIVPAGLTYDYNRSEVLSSSVEDVDVEVTIANIIAASQCFHECLSTIVTHHGTPRCTDFPFGLTTQQIVDDMCEGRYTDGFHNCTSKAHLPARLWLVDFLLQRNACPLGHKTQR